MKELARKVIEGDIRAAAKLMRAVDDDLEGSEEALSLLYSHTGNAYIIGITGHSGSGKSTLISSLIEIYRKEGHCVGVVAIDPTSPFTGGSILGDRIRMQKHFLDPRVFIRSLASRGRMGGISASTYKIVQIMDAMGFSRIFVETLGVGQDEVDVAKIADTTVVIFTPGLGDEIQTIKAGLVEIGDIFVVNKGDRPDADSTVLNLKRVFDSSSELKWPPPVIKTIATQGNGIRDLFEGIESHKKYLEEKKLLIKKKNLREEEILRSAIKEKIFKLMDYYLQEKFFNSKIHNAMMKKTLSPYEIANKFIKKFTKIYDKEAKKKKKTN